MRARTLAEIGYTALAVDMYGDGKTADHPDTAKQFMSEVAVSFCLPCPHKIPRTI